MEKPSRKIKYSSKKRFDGSASHEAYGEGYFLHGIGSNYGSVGSDGTVFAPYTEVYLERNRKVVEVLLNTLSGVRKAIVLGCARGYMVKAFRERGVDAVGVDISRWAIDNCTEGVEDYLYCGDICDLSLWKDNEFDIVIAFDVLEHIKVPDLYKAIDETARVGRVVVLDVPIMPHDDAPDQTHGTDATHVSCYSRDWWFAQFMARGMEPFGRPHEYIYPREHDKAAWSDGHDHGYTAYFRKPAVAPTPETVPTAKIATGGKDFKILWWSNAPFVGTGYGLGTAGVVYPLLKHYNVYDLASYGLEGKTLRLDGLYIWPKRFSNLGTDAAQLLCQRWKPDILVTLFDIWVDEASSEGTPGWLSGMHPRWVPIIPIDQEPVPPPILNPARKAYRPVAMSRFGQRKLEDEGVRSTYIPHGVDWNLFKPSEDKVASRQHLYDISIPLVRGNDLEWPENTFVIGKVGANKDTQRKGYDTDAMALRIFFDNNPDAKKDTRVHLHTSARFPTGFNIDHWFDMCGVSQYCRVTDPFFIYQGLTYEDMATLYGGYDILLNAARGEGFGIPIIEAQSCEVPVIGTNCTSMPELIKGHGWLVKNVKRNLTSLLGFRKIPDEYELAEHIADAYNHPDKVAEFGKKARAFTRNYDWSGVVVPLWIDLIEEIREDLRPKTLKERRRML